MRHAANSVGLRRDIGKDEGYRLTAENRALNADG